MWAYRLSAPGSLSRVDVPSPEPDHGQVLLRTVAGGMCGSDLPKFHAVRGFVDRPGYPMHEVVGDVVVSQHPAVPAGARVVGWSVDSTAIAEYVVTDGAQVHAYTATDDPVLAVLIQSLACVLYALQSVDVTGRHVAVIGLGPIGLLFAHEAAACGAALVTGVDRVDRSDMASRFGIEDLIKGDAADWSYGLKPSDRPDVVIEAVGHQTATLDSAIEACRLGGQILYFGIPDQDVYPIDMERMVRKNLTLKAGITRDRAVMLALADRRLAEAPDRFRALITETLPFTRIQEAFEAASTPRPCQAKLVITGV